MGGGAGVSFSYIVIMNVRNSNVMVRTRPVWGPYILCLVEDLQVFLSRSRWKFGISAWVLVGMIL